MARSNQAKHEIVFRRNAIQPANGNCRYRWLAEIAKANGILLVVDNCFCTPILQRPFEFGADIVIHSATKYFDGQGRVLGGAVLGRQEMIDDSILPFLRTAGPSISPFNAWICLKGLETLKIRMEAQCNAAAELANWLVKHRQYRARLFPWLARSSAI